MKRIESLEKLASETIGDGANNRQEPNLYFVTQEGNVVLVTTSFATASREFDSLARLVNQECALEDRLCGVLASVQHDIDEETEEELDRLVLLDERGVLARYYPECLA